MVEPAPVSETVEDQEENAPAAKKKRRGLWVHLALWGVMILYLLISPVVEAKYFIKEGRPVEVEGAVPGSTNQIQYAVDKVSAVWLNGERVYKVVGWSFIDSGKALSDYQVYLVLNAGAKSYFYPAIPTKRGDIQKAFPDVKIDLTYAGFAVHIAKETLSRGNYPIGFLYVDNDTGEMVYQQSASIITRTPNTLRLEIASQ